MREMSKWNNTIKTGKPPGKERDGALQLKTFRGMKRRKKKQKKKEEEKKKKKKKMEKKKKKKKKKKKFGSHACVCCAPCFLGYRVPKMSFYCILGPTTRSSSVAAATHVVYCTMEGDGCQPKL